MENSCFWDLVNTYEETSNYDENISYVPKKFYNDLLKDIVDENNKDEEECVADLEMFKFKCRYTPKYLINKIRKMCK